ncbi:g9808 [Coccomyxa viridis]|uniref:G9808 protein n=1 Tax=Coccomyxa viridis TaxID=1274662 RepID=A0ABP1G6D3_9CHLO
MEKLLGRPFRMHLPVKTSSGSINSEKYLHQGGAQTSIQDFNVSRYAFKASKRPPRQVGVSIEAVSRRDMMYGAAAAAIAPMFSAVPAAAAETATRQEVDTTITDVVYLDVGYCPAGANQNRTLGESAICKTTDALGRIIIGLYGHVVPTTVANFVKLVRDGAYKGTVFSKVLPGEYIEAGRQGSPRLGEVKPPTDLLPNTELLDALSFRLEHSRPGTVSIAIAENDDDPLLRQRSNYRYTEFLITTGPGPVPSLDGQNIVIGTVLEGYQTLARIATQQTFKPNQRIQQVNKLASLIGDDRAARTRAKYGKPLKPIVMTDVGVLPIREPFPRPF